MLGRINEHLNLNPTFKPIFTNALLNGSADIRIYLELYQAVVGTFTFGTAYDYVQRVAIWDTTFAKRYDPATLSPISLYKLPEGEKLLSINNVRNQAGLETLEESRKKLIQSIKNSRNGIHSDFTFLFEINFEEVHPSTYKLETMYKGQLNNLVPIID